MKEIIDRVQTLGIIGLAKNTGKTTTLNTLIQLYKNMKLGLTSIGLDGEDLDQVTFLPKPKIWVNKGMIVATASSCLKSAKLLFRVLEITELNTSLGYVHIIEVIEPGTLVVAGPTTNHDLNVLVAKMGTYAEKIFVDGAFNRITFANIKNMDGIVLTTGASVHPDMMKTIERTKRVVESFSLKQTPIFKKLPDFKMMIQTPNTTLQFTNKKSETLKTALMGLNESVSTIYIQGAITPRHIQVFIECATQRFTLISDDPTKYLISEHYFSYLEKLETRLQIIFPCPLLFITINPFCPKGHHYEPIIFLSEMKKAIKIPIYNVKEMEW